MNNPIMKTGFAPASEKDPVPPALSPRITELMNMIQRGILRINGWDTSRNSLEEKLAYSVYCQVQGICSRCQMPVNITDGNRTCSCSGYSGM